jgi:branched-chain amino acid aminotransferase
MNQSRKFYSVINDEVITSDDLRLNSINPSLVIYEVIRIIDSKCLFLEDHLFRLFSSIAFAKRKHFINQNDVKKNIYRLVTSNKLVNGNIRVEIWFNQSEVYLFSHIIPHHYPASTDYQRGVRAITYKTERDNPNAKILNTILREKVNNLLERSKAWEVLLINQQNQITEGSRSNVFAIEQNTIYTPPATDVLPGITRKHVINLCRKVGAKLIERDINYNEINQFEVFFITGTSPKVLPLRMIDDIYFKSSNKILEDLRAAYDKMIMQYIDKAEIPMY